MKPVAIFRHAATEGPGYLGEFLNKKSIPWQLIRIDEDETVPTSTDAFSGLVFMGGPMSVNDNLPWTSPVLTLIRDAIQQDIPVLGHCLGGQLMAKALNASITHNKYKEIGWGDVHVTESTSAQHWFGSIRSFVGFHWHGETFDLPNGAVRILSNTHCDNQAFAFGKHLGFQCHIEMTEAMIRDWCSLGIKEIEASSDSPAVQSPQTIFIDINRKVAKLNSVANQVYTRWIEGLRF